MIQEWSAKKTCAIHSNSCDVHLCPPSHPPYHQKKDCHHASQKEETKNTALHRAIMDERVKHCAGCHLPMSFGAGFNQFEAPYESSQPPCHSFNSGMVFSLEGVQPHILCSSLCFLKDDYKKCIPFPPHHSCKEAPWCFEESPLEYTSWQCERRISCYSSAQ